MIRAILVAGMLAVFGVGSAVAHPATDDVVRKLKAGDYDGITGGMLSLGGKLVFEAYAPGFDAGERHDIRSATKSITALLIGELIEDGRLKNVDVKVADILPDEFVAVPKGSDKRDITIEDILTMRTGLACNDWVPASVGHEDKMYKTRDWAAFLLGQPIAHEVGKHFSYCTGGVVLLGRVLKKLSGRDVPAYAEERLFRPLGIEGAKWESTPKGYTDTGGHLRLKLSDLHKIGLMVAARGATPGGTDMARNDTKQTQVVSEKWLDKVTEEHTKIYERRQRYGYLWWLDSGEVKGKPVSLIYAHGNGGNFIFIIPELELVAAFTGKNYGKPTQFIPMQVLTQEIVPLLIGGQGG
ncbi:serine hydrolase domain-containing protein [Kordiimonas aestuarii]|uniref:serine hydrolase domain-containing protein n=1 Tax=Kordiimonas aestuarii TaxID=1005925 RepID=UPI0021D1C406|nr:serine hydrolase domain-containing protein [Kordiimonas aestuarii]